MALLEQQELMVPPPTRTLEVPSDHTAVWGIDPSTKALALAWIDEDELRGGHLMPIRQTNSAERLGTIYDITQELCARATEYSGRPGLVVVEQVSGEHVHRELLYVVGVVLASVYAYLAGDPPVAAIETMPPGRWKKIACGRGDIYKPKVSDLKEYGVLTWAKANGYGGSSWDMADAWGIAEAGRRDTKLVVQPTGGAA